LDKGGFIMGMNTEKWAMIWGPIAAEIIKVVIRIILPGEKNKPDKDKIIETIDQGGLKWKF